MVEPEAQSLVNQQTVAPVQEANEQLVVNAGNRKVSKWVVFALLFCLLLVSGGISIYVYSQFHKTISSKASQNITASVSIIPTMITPAITQPTITDGLYRDQYIQFSNQPS